jgi:Antibiotic biosynthesis monooxygenase
MIVEISQFRLVQGADEGGFLEAADETQSAFLAKQEGFVGRDLLRADDGSWMDIVRFESVQAARAAFNGFAGHPAVKAFESMLDTSSVSMSHWSVSKSW